jgi:hypothetical protein
MSWFKKILGRSCDQQTAEQTGSSRRFLTSDSKDVADQPNQYGLSQEDLALREQFSAKLSVLSSSLGEILNTPSDFAQNAPKPPMAYDGWINRHWDLWVEFELPEKKNGLELLTLFEPIEKRYLAHIEGLYNSQNTQHTDFAKNDICVWGWNRLRADYDYERVLVGFQMVWCDRCVSEQTISEFLVAIELLGAQLNARLTLPTPEDWSYKTSSLTDLIQDTRSHVFLKLVLPKSTTHDLIRQVFTSVKGKRAQDTWVWFDPYDMPAIECVSESREMEEAGVQEDDGSVEIFKFHYRLPTTTKNTHAFEDLWSLVELVALKLGGVVYRADDRQVDTAFAQKQTANILDFYQNIGALGLAVGGHQCRRYWARFQETQKHGLVFA